MAQQYYFHLPTSLILLLIIFSTTQAIAASDTGFLSPTANQADRGGDGNGYQTDPANAYKLDGLFAVDVDSGTTTNAICSNSGKDRHRFYNYNISVPSEPKIKGIEVRLDVKANSTENSPTVCVQLSWNGGTSWTSSRMAGPVGTSLQTFILGSPTDVWEHAWNPDELSNANFRLRLADMATDTSHEFSLDWVAVRISYQDDEKEK